MVFPSIFVQIKILKRRSDGSSPSIPPTIAPISSSSKQYKTLAEREADYASARYLYLCIRASILCMCVSKGWLTI